MLTTITQDGDYYLNISGSSNVPRTSSSTIRALSSGGATVMVGEEISGSFFEFDDSDVGSIGGVFEHGKGSKLMVRVSGYTADFVVSHRES